MALLRLILAIGFFKHDAAPSLSVDYDARIAAWFAEYDRSI